ncbi:sugar transferase [Candidatus Woesearchaeota archaeon]|nr:sugar transferase [Candidatus Woesearchaeota archaeon]
MIYLYFKRFLDIVVSFLLIVFLFPIFILISLFVFFDSKGPIFFTQRRVGKNGRIFYIIKFRTMYVDSVLTKLDLAPFNEASFPTFKIKNDPRLTNFGYKLSRSGFDELPQLFNILKGDMSFIGFRPPTEDEVLHYNSVQKTRFLGTPGIISLWVVKGGHNLSFDSWVDLDLNYNKNISFFLDFAILLEFMWLLLKKCFRVSFFGEFLFWFRKLSFFVKYFIISIFNHTVSIKKKMGKIKLSRDCFFLSKLGKKYKIRFFKNRSYYDNFVYLSSKFDNVFPHYVSKNSYSVCSDWLSSDNSDTDFVAAMGLVTGKFDSLKYSKNSLYIKFFDDLRYLLNKKLISFRMYDKIIKMYSENYYLSKNVSCVTLVDSSLSNFLVHDNTCYLIDENSIRFSVMGFTFFNLMLSSEKNTFNFDSYLNSYKLNNEPLFLSKKYFTFCFISFLIKNIRSVHLKNKTYCFKLIEHLKKLVANSITFFDDLIY